VFSVGVNEGSPKFVCGKGELRCGLWENLVIGSWIDSLVVFFVFTGSVCQPKPAAARAYQKTCVKVTLLWLVSFQVRE
jgi:hypothetical protein